VENVGNEEGTCRDDEDWRVKQKGENGFVLEKSSANGADGGWGREKMVSGGEKIVSCTKKMVDVAMRRRRAVGRRR